MHVAPLIFLLAVGLPNVWIIMLFDDYGIMKYGYTNKVSWLCQLLKFSILYTSSENVKPPQLIFVQKMPH